MSFDEWQDTHDTTQNDLALLQNPPIDQVQISQTVVTTGVGTRLQFSWSIIHPFFRLMIDP